MRWVAAILMVILMGAQAVQAGHVHAADGLTAECAQCHAQGGQALAATDAPTPPCLPVACVSHPDTAAATVATFYRLAARGPPARSS